MPVQRKSSIMKADARGGVAERLLSGRPPAIRRGWAAAFRRGGKFESLLGSDVVSVFALHV
jgi:hypothetical protein